MKTTTKYPYYECPNCKYQMTDVEYELGKCGYPYPSCEKVTISKFRTVERIVEK